MRRSRPCLRSITGRMIMLGASLALIIVVVIAFVYAALVIASDDDDKNGRG